MSIDVFKKLRIKISISIALVLAMVLAALIGSLNVYLTTSNKKNSFIFISQLIENDGKRMGPNGKSRNEETDCFNSERNTDEESKYDMNDHHVPPKEPNYGGRMGGINPIIDDGIPPELEQQQCILSQFLPIKNSYLGFRNFYTAKLDENGNVTEVVNKFSEAYEDVAALVNTIYKLKKKSGIYEYFGYEVAKKDYGYLIVILDRANELSQERSFAIVSLITYGLSLLLTFGLAWTFALWSLKPVQEAFIKQKQFIADASHELKTPIAVIGANIDVLQQDLPESKWLQYIKTENTRMGELVKNLLYLAKNDAGREKMTMLPFDLGDSIACAVLPFESVAFEQGKKLEINIPKDPIPVIGDESKIKQVVIILTDNALKNSEKNAVIRITVGFENNKRCVKVYNTGHGIAPEDMNKIFNRFFRLDTSRDRKTGGYGLGLSIAQTIAKAHGGQICVESELGKYAEFTLILPYGVKKSERCYTDSSKRGRNG